MSINLPALWAQEEHLRAAKKRYVLQLFARHNLDLLFAQEDHILRHDQKDVFKWAQGHDLYAFLSWAQGDTDHLPDGTNPRIWGVSCFCRRDVKKRLALQSSNVTSRRILKIAAPATSQDPGLSFYNVYFPQEEEERAELMEHLGRQLRRERGPVYVVGDWNCFFAAEDRYYFTGVKHREEKVCQKEFEVWRRVCEQNGLLELPQRDDSYTHIHNSLGHATRLTRCYANVRKSYLAATNWGLHTDTLQPEDLSDHFGVLYTPTAAPKPEGDSFLYRFPEVFLHHPHAEPAIRELFRAFVGRRTGVDPFTPEAQQQLQEEADRIRRGVVATTPAPAGWYSQLENVLREEILERPEFLLDELRTAFWQATDQLRKQPPAQVSTDEGRLLLLTQVLRILTSGQIGDSQDKALQAAAAAYPELAKGMRREIHVPTDGLRRIVWAADQHYLTRLLDEVQQRVYGPDASEPDVSPEEDAGFFLEEAGSPSRPPASHAKSMKQRLGAAGGGSPDLTLFVTAQGDITPDWGLFLPEVRAFWEQVWDHEASADAKDLLRRWHVQRPAGDDIGADCAPPVNLHFQRPGLIDNLAHMPRSSAGPDRIPFEAYKVVRAWFADILAASIAKKLEGTWVEFLRPEPVGIAAAESDVPPRSEVGGAIRPGLSPDAGLTHEGPPPLARAAEPRERPLGAARALAEMLANEQRATESSSSSLPVGSPPQRWRR
jgi:exonuclease III